MDDLDIECQEPCCIAKCEHDTRSRPAPAASQPSVKQDTTSVNSINPNESRVLPANAHTLSLQDKHDINFIDAGINCGNCDEWDAAVDEVERAVKFLSVDREILSVVKQACFAVRQKQNWLKQHDTIIRNEVLDELQELVASLCPSDGIHKGWILAFPLDQWIADKKKSLRTNTTADKGGE